MTEITTQVPRRRGINLRLIVFGIVVLAIVGYPAYQYIDEELSGGVKQLRNNIKQVDLKAMSVFSFDQINGRLEDVPAKWRELDGQKVVLYGEMWVTNSVSPELDRFDLCYSIAKCCFSGPPQVQHFVNSRAVNGSVPFYSGLVKVSGTLHVKVIPGEGKVASVYQLDVDNVQPAG